MKKNIFLFIISFILASCRDGYVTAYDKYVIREITIQEDASIKNDDYGKPVRFVDSYKYSAQNTKNHGTFLNDWIYFKSTNNTLRIGDTITIQPTLFKTHDRDTLH